MATVPSLVPQAVGDPALAWTDTVKTAFDFLKAPPVFAVSDPSTSIPTAAYTALTFTGETADTDAGHSTTVNTARYTAATAGYFSGVATVEFDSGGASSRRVIGIRKNGAAGDPTEGRQDIYAVTGVACLSVAFLTPMVVGDYIEVVAYQDSGVTLTATGTFKGLWVRT